MELDKETIQFEAEKFLDYFSRIPNREIEEVFKGWANSKDFEPEDRHAIWKIVEAVTKKESA